MQQDLGRERPFGNEMEAIVRLGGEPIGEETLGGRTVQVYQVTDDLGRRQVWVSDDERQIPIRLKGFRRSTGQTMQTDFLNWTRGLPITDVFFQPEPDIELKHFEFETYLQAMSERQPLGPVPVLYTDLLHGH